MTEQLDKEVQAIKSVLAALEPLAPDVRANVLDYVIRRLRVVIGPLSPLGSQEAAAATLPERAVQPSRVGIHIEKFKEEKQPKSANEMAAVVAYYLANLASQPQRKATVNSKDIETYFKIANFPLPKQIRVTLQNARNAGYFDSVGDGEYKLNAVGHNLVVHNLPRTSSAPAPRKKVKARGTKTKSRARKPKRS